MGFNLLSTANNHMGDFGPDGAIAAVDIYGGPTWPLQAVVATWAKR